MQKYKRVFASFHTLYRLTLSSKELKDFFLGVGRLYKNLFAADETVLLCKNFNSAKLAKIKIKGKEPILKKGGISILSKRERAIFDGEKQIILENRLIFPFIFLDCFGCVYIKRKVPPFNELEKRWFISFSEQVSVSLKLLNLYIEEKRIILSYIKAFSNILSQHVPTSHIHHKSLAKLIKALGEALYLNEIEIKSLTFASLLHDAGKIDLPEELLKKQSSLTDDEYRAIMSHPKKGVDLIKDLSSLKPVIPIILHHHERYDGKGYPSSLKKEKIPLGSRILAILDAFDAMFFGRPYKEKVGMEVIEQELKKQRGHQFDPKIVDVFLKILKRKGIRKYLNSLR